MSDVLRIYGGDLKNIFVKKHPVIVSIGILLLFSLIGTWPLLNKGFIPTHDGEYTIIRFMEFYRMLSEGILFPQWAPTVNSGYGLPIFIFYYPLTNYIGAAFHVLGWNFVESVKLSLAAGYAASMIFCFLWLRRLFGSTLASLAGSIVGAFVPYWFVELYVRGTVPEVWAIAFLFACFYAVESKQNVLAAFSMCFLILSHNILAFIFAPFLLGYSFIQSRKMIPWLVAGICLSSYFWIPALWERKYVVGLNTVSLRDHFANIYELLIPSWGTEFSGGEGLSGNKMSFQIGLVPLGILAFLFTQLIRRKKDLWHRYVVYFSFCIAGAIVFMLPYSNPLWNSIPLLQYVQYPWRFLAFCIPAAAFGAAYVVSRTKKKRVVFLLIVLSIGASYAYTKPVVYESRDDAYYSSRRNFTDGTVSMGNSFSTIWTGWKRERPDYVLEVTNGKAPGGIVKHSFMKKTFSVRSDIGSEVMLPILYYPGWKVFIDQKDAPVNYTAEGTIGFAVPQGEHKVIVVFTHTRMRIFANILSLAALVWLLGWGILRGYAYRNRHVPPEGRSHEPRRGRLHQKSH